MREELRGRWCVAYDVEGDEEWSDMVPEADADYHLACTPRAIRELVAAMPDNAEWWLRQHEQAGSFHSKTQRKAVMEEATRIARILRRHGCDLSGGMTMTVSYSGTYEGKTYRVRWIGRHPYLYRRDPGKKDKSLGRVDDQEAAAGPMAIPGLVQKLTKGG